MRTGIYRYIGNIENEVHGRQGIAYKILKHFNKDEMETSTINVINVEEYQKHYTQLWLDPNGNNAVGYSDESINTAVDDLTLEEFDYTKNT